MIIIDRALAARAASGNPIRVGMVGAGFMGRGIANVIVNSVPGMKLVAISNRRLERAAQAYAEAGIDQVRTVESVERLEEAIHQGQYAVTENPSLLCRAENIDALLEVTGHVEFGAHVAMEALANGKHLILLNADLEGTVGPILRVYADKAGVVISNADGDQPAVEMNLYRFVESIGLRPLVCGNIKGLQDRYRNPTTQESFARQWGQSAAMVTTFADGTKINFEQAIVANATGMRAPKRGLLGRDHKGHVDELTTHYDIEQLESWGGIVDYVVGTKPSPGVYVLATHDDPKQRQRLDLLKLGPGPLYPFYIPYHLTHFEAPLSVARAVLFQDAAIAPAGALLVEVIAVAKTDLRAGDVIDGVGHYMTYGECENADVCRAENLLPMGLAEGCRLKRNVPKDQALTYADVELPTGRLVDRLRAEQDRHFAPADAALVAA